MTVNDALTVVMHRQSQEDNGAKKSGDVKKNGATPAKKGVNSEGEEDEEQPMPVELQWGEGEDVDAQAQQQQAQPPSQGEPTAQPRGAMPWGWCGQSFSCVWCKAEMYLEGHGSWPFVKAQENGWRKSTKKSWEASATCSSCAAKHR